VAETSSLNSLLYTSLQWHRCDAILTEEAGVGVLYQRNNIRTEYCTFASCRTLLLNFRFLFPSLCGLSMFKTLYCVLNTCHFKIFTFTTCFGLNWPSSSVNSCFFKKIAVILFSHARSSLCFSFVPVPRCFLACLPCLACRQGNNEEQAHTKNKGTNEHDQKKTAFFLKRNINT
jgi:hypothetical protein